jgi:ketosteroid isomerase-like protein
MPVEDQECLVFSVSKFPPTQRQNGRVGVSNKEVTLNGAVSIARATYTAYVEKDRAGIEALIADDFHFTSPLDNRIDRATYFARCWPNSESSEGFDFIHLVPDGERVFVTYEGRRNDHRFRNTEILTVKDGQITDIEVYFGWSIPHEVGAGRFADDSAGQDILGQLGQKDI